MVVKTPKEWNLLSDLEDIWRSVRSYSMWLYHIKCSFEVQSGKFLGFMPTRRWIKVNPNKWHTIIEIRSPTIVKEVWQLTGRLATLSRCISFVEDKVFHFFVTLKKKVKFEWASEFEDAFVESKTFLATPRY